MMKTEIDEYYLKQAHNRRQGHRTPRACKTVKQTRTVAVARFFKSYGQEMARHLCPHDQRGSLQHLDFIEVDKTRKMESQCNHDEDGRQLRNKDGPDSLTSLSAKYIGLETEPRQYL